MEKEDHQSTPEPKAELMTPSTAMTNETTPATVGTTWYSYYSQENDREYFYEPVSGTTSWVAPTCGPSGSPVLRRGEGEEDDEDSHHTPLIWTAESDGDKKSGCELLMKGLVAPPRSLRVKLAYWGIALLASNLLLMCWTRYSLRNVNVEQVASVGQDQTETLVCEPCPSPKEEEPTLMEGEPLPLCEPVACEPVACEPGACEPVACQPVPCDAVPCEPMACDPCPPPPECKSPIVEYRCLPQTPSVGYDFEGNYVAQKYVHRILQDNVKALDQVWQHIESAALSTDKSDANTQLLSLGSDLLPKVCRIPLAKRVVPECRDGTMESNSRIAFGMM